MEKNEIYGQERLFVPESIADPRRVLIKLGSNSTTAETLQRVADQSVWLKDNEYQVTIVSSGAIMRGRARTGIDGTSTLERQSLSTVGQPILMADWINVFGDDAVVAQELVHNGGGVRNDTFTQVLDNNLDLGWITIINYNDARNSLETEQDRVNADNDRLTATIATMMRPGMTIFLTGADGVLAEDGELIYQTTPDQLADLPLLEMEKSSNGTGGMRSKLETCGRIVTDIGGWGVITRAETFDAQMVLRGGARATYVCPSTSPLLFTSFY